MRLISLPATASGSSVQGSDGRVPFGHPLLAALALTVTLGVGSPSVADWLPGDGYKMHYPQLPDLSPSGVDVDASQNWLADDFQCTDGGPVTGIHIWGSWKQDNIADANHVAFTLALYADQPADPCIPGTYSTPAGVLWSRAYAPGEFTVRVEANELSESYWDPIYGTLTSDTVCYEYNFAIPEAEAFDQTSGTIYWLGVSAVPLEGYTQFGWKSSAAHFMDDAVYWDATFGMWIDMHYPVGHPLNPLSMDLAFVVTPEPATLSLLALGALAAIARTAGRRPLAGPGKGA